jgi:hypothetical protein
MNEGIERLKEVFVIMNNDTPVAVALSKSEADFVIESGTETEDKKEIATETRNGHTRIFWSYYKIHVINDTAYGALRFKKSEF